MGKRVKVVTKCGETFTYDHDQEVDTVEVIDARELVFDKNGVKVYETDGGVEVIQDARQGQEKTRVPFHCNGFIYYTNIKGEEHPIYSHHGIE